MHKYQGAFWGVLLALAAAALLAYATSAGPNGYSDSAAYMVAGRNLAQGAGLGYPQPDGSFYTLTHYPPLYSLTYSLYAWLGLDAVEAGRWFNLLALAAAVAVLVSLFKRFSAAPQLGLLAALLLLAFPPATGVYASLMSDGPFLTLFLLSLWALLNYLHNQGRNWLLAAIMLAATLPLTRYVGLVLVASSSLVLFIFAEGKARHRLKQALAYGLVALLPIGLWLAWVYLGVDASLGGRGGAQGQSLLALFQQFRAYFTDIVWAWIPFMRVPSALPYWLRQLIFLALAAGAMAQALRMGRRPSAEDRQPAAGIQLFWAFALSGASYLLGMAAAFTFTTPAPDITDRTLLPFFACALGAAFALLSSFIVRHPGRRRAAWAATLAASLLFVAAFAQDTLDLARELHDGQQGFFTQHWRASETLAGLRHLPAEQSIVADRAAALLFWVDRPAHELLDFVDEDGNMNAALQAAFARGETSFVIFDDFPQWVQDRRGPQAADGATSLPTSLEVLHSYADGAIYRVNE